MSNTVDIVIVFKTKKSDGTHEDLKISDLNKKDARKIWNKILKQWAKAKMISIPTHQIAISGDEIFTMVMYG